MSFKEQTLDDNLKSNRRNYLISRRYVLLLITVISSLLLLSSYLYYNVDSNYIKQEKDNQLKTIANLKFSQIYDWNKERFADAKIFSSNPYLIKIVHDFLISKSNSRIKLEILKQFILLKEENEYENIFIVSRNGKVILSLDPKLNKISASTVSLVNKSILNREILSSDLYVCKAHKDIHLDYIAPIIDLNRSAIAAVILRVNPKDYLYPLLENAPLPCKSAETLIVRKDGNYALYLSVLHNQVNKSLNFKVPLTELDVPAVQAILGFKGIFKGHDYKGVDVTAYIKPIVNTPWYIITKVNQSDIYAGLYFKEFIIIAITTLLILFVSVGLIWLYHYRQRNIYKELFVKEKELREYHQEFKSILYSIGDGVITADISSKIKQMNHAAEELTGWEEKEAVGIPLYSVFNLINKNQINKIDDLIQKVLEDGSFSDFVNYASLVSKSGKEILIAFSVAPIPNEKGEVGGIVLVFRDKTMQHQAEKAIRESEEKYRKLVEVSPDAIVVHVDNKFVYINPAGLKLLGVKKDSELLGKSVLDIVHPEYKELVINRSRVAIEKGLIQGLAEEKFLRVDGTVLDAEVISIPILFNGKSAIQVVARDISERKQAELELNQAFEKISAEKSKSDAILSAIGDGICIQDLDFRIIYQNQVHKDLIGEHIGKYCYNAYENQEGVCVGCPLKSTFLNEGICTSERTIFKDDVILNLEITTSPLKDSKGKIVAGIEAVRNVTERKKTESRIEKINECFLSFGFDSIDNINRLTKLCGEIMGATAALYNRLDDNKLCSWGMWNTPDSYNPIDDPSGHICFDVINNGRDDIIVVRNLLQSNYANTDPNVSLYQLQTYVGKAVGYAGSYVGSLCVVFQKDFIPTESDKWIIGIIASAIAVEEQRKEANFVILENEERYKSFINSTNDLIFLKDEQFKHLVVNIPLADFYGLKPDELIGLTDFDINSETAAKQCRFTDLETITTNAMVISEESFNNRVFETTKFPVRLRNNKVGVGGIIRDITKSKQSEKEYRLLAHSISSINECISITDINNIFLFVNDAFLKTYGYTKEELIGKHISIVQSHDPESETNRNILQHTIDGGWKGEMINKKKDGSIFPIYLSKSVVTDDNNNPLALIGVAADISESKKVREELIKEKEKAEKSDKLKTEFLAQVSHEIRTPLVTIDGYTSMIQSDLNEGVSENFSEYFEAISVASKRMQRTFDLIVNAAQIITNNFEPIFINIDLFNDVLKPIFNDFILNAKQKQLEFILTNESSNKKINVDNYSIHQLFSNLIDNAIKFTKSGFVRIKLYEDKDNLIVKVMDSGIGISNEFLPIIFEPFRQEEQGYSRIFEGNGLGLMVAKHYCDINNAELIIDSTKGIGSTFTVIFNLVQ